MGRFFDLDSPLVRMLNKVADLMWLNILTLICCLPVFTIGASLTACHYVALKIRRNEEGYITKEFFKSFKMNFKQATLIWMVSFFLILILATDFVIIRTDIAGNVGYWVEVLLMVTALLLVFTLCWVFAMLAKFTNTTKATLKNAFALSLMNFPKTIVMIICYAVPVVLGIFFIQFFPFVLMFGISVPVFVSALLYNKNFKKLEEKILARIEAERGPVQEEPEENDERIFRDMSEQEG